MNIKNVKIQDLVEKVGLDRTIFKPIFDSHIQVLFRDIHDKQFCREFLFGDILMTISNLFGNSGGFFI